MLWNVIADRGVQATAAAAGVLAAASLVRPLPWPLWAAWAAVGAFASVQAVRDERRAAS